MINILFITAILGIAIIMAVIFALHGKNKGLRYGVRILCFTVLSAVLSVLLAPFAAAELAKMDFVKNLIVSVVDMAEEYNASSVLLIKMLTDSAKRVLEIPSAILIFLVSFVSAELIYAAVRAIVKPKSGEPKGGIQGSVMAAAAPLLLAAYIIFVPDVKLFDETKNADRLLKINSNAITEDDVDFLCGFYFGTTLLDANENERLELVNTTFDSITSKNGSGIFSELSRDCVYATADEVKKDAAALFFIASNIDISESADKVIDELAASPDIERLADSIYSLKFGDRLVRLIIGEAISSLCGGTEFSYPADKDINGTEEAFAELVRFAAAIKQNQQNIAAEIPKIRSNPLISSEMLSELGKVMR